MRRTTRVWIDLPVVAERLTSEEDDKESDNKCPDNDSEADVDADAI